jgi:hypothetical protein
MTDLRWFLLCIFGFLLVVSGFPVWYFQYVPFDNCRDKCGYADLSCSSSCLEQTKTQNAAGIILMVLGSVVVVCSCPIVTRRLKSQTNLTGAPTQANTGSANLREQLNTQSAQLQAITERLAQMEKGRETETRPLGSEVINNYYLN